MQQREELDWVGSVLRDVVKFLAMNDMKDSAMMLTVAAVHIERDMKRERPVPQPTVKTPTNVVMFPSRKGG